MPEKKNKLMALSPIKRWQWWTAVLAFPLCAYGVAQAVPFSEAFPFFVLFVYATAAAAWWQGWQAGALSYGLATILIVSGWHLTPAAWIRFFANITLIPWVLYFVERVKRARRLEEAAARARLAAELSHQLNSPLQAAVNAAYLLQSECASEASRKYADIAITEIQRASRLATKVVRTVEGE